MVAGVISVSCLWNFQLFESAAMDETKYDFSVEKNHTSSHDSYHDWYIWKYAHSLLITANHSHPNICEQRERWMPLFFNKSNYLNESILMPIYRYKEPVQTKYLSQVKPGQQKHFYNTKNWIFLRQGLDDFRDGFPPIGSRYIKVLNRRFKSLVDYLTHIIFRNHLVIH